MQREPGRIQRGLRREASILRAVKDSPNSSGPSAGLKLGCEEGVIPLRDCLFRFCTTGNECGRLERESRTDENSEKYNKETGKG